MEWSSSGPHTPWENKATADYKGASTFVHLTMSLLVAREVKGKDCRPHRDRRAQHYTAAEKLSIK